MFVVQCFFSLPSMKFLLGAYRNFRDPRAEIMKIYTDPGTYSSKWDVFIKYFSSDPREPRGREDRMSSSIRRS